MLNGVMTRQVPALLLFLTFAVCPSRGTAEEPISSAEDIRRLSDWIGKLQYTNPSVHASFGAIRRHHTTGAGTPGLYQVTPYWANIAMLGLLRSGAERRRERVENWITWYVGHIRPGNEIDGTVVDHWYRADGSGETTCPAGIKPAECDTTDATDSAAATLLSLVSEYADTFGADARRFLLSDEIDARRTLKRVAEAVLRLQQEDGLTWAKSDYRVKFLMDNCEVYHGLQAAARLQRTLLQDLVAAKRYETAAQRVRSAISGSLYDASTQLYRPAKFEDGNAPAADLNKWYPDTVAQLWPQLFSVVPPSGTVARRSMTLVNNHWDGAPKGDWTRTIVDPAGAPFPSVGYAAIRTRTAANRTRAKRQIEIIRSKFFPGEPGPADFPWPFTIADAGWLLMTLRSLQQ